MKKFTWHFPDETGLHTFCSQFLGWDHQESTKLLDPIMKKLKERGGMRQRRLDDYFVSYGDNERFARFRSKRLRSAVKVIYTHIYMCVCMCVCGAIISQAIVTKIIGANICD